MEHFLINSSVCLFVLWLAYKLLLENTSWHPFKRFYLIGALILSMLIPFIVVDTIVIPMEEIPFINDAQLPFMESGMEKPVVAFRWLYIGWSVYVVGAFIMLWRFGKNLHSFKIQQEDEISSYATYQLILRNSFTIPHSFLTRIFISKKDQESNKIPRVVLEHEKAHLDQKHSLDVLFIEFLLIAFWFHPLLYIIKYSIKLNHEFLADRAVLSQGISTSAYQEILLEQATNSYQQAMANTFTFPIIKKRFHIMKTHTSNTSLVFRSLALIPVIALLVISCGKEETEFEEVVALPIIFEVVEEPNQKMIIVDPNDPEGNITINGAPHVYKINGEQINIYNEQGELQDFESQGYEIRRTDEILEIVGVLENLTEKDIIEYNQLAILHKERMKSDQQLMVLEGKTLRMQLLFNSMSKEQRASNEPWPFSGTHYGVAYKSGQIPPPPAPAAPTKDQGYIKVDGKIYPYTLKGTEKNFYDHKGDLIDVTGKTVEYIDQKDLPPPPPPMSAIDYIKSHKDELNYYLGEKRIGAEDAIRILKKQGQQGVEISPDGTGTNAIKIKETKENKNLLPPPPPMKTTYIKGGTWKDVEKSLKKEATENKTTRRIIGDPIDVININREKYMYYVDGKILNYEEALLIVAKNEHWNIYRTTIAGKTAMMINTYDVIFGPEEIQNRSDC